MLRQRRMTISVICSNYTYMRYTPPWLDTEIQKYPALSEDEEADVVIIGGGISGIQCAYHLANAGVSVVVLEAKRLCANATSYTTAFITQIIDTPLYVLNTLIGQKEAADVWHSGIQAIDTLAATIEKEDIACEFERCPAFLFAFDPTQVSAIEQEYVAARDSGFRIEKNNHPTFAFANHGYIEIPDQAKFHPRKFVAGLAQAAVKKGVRIYERSEVKTIKGTETITASTAKGNIKAQAVIIATYEPIIGKIQTFMKKGMYASYVMAMKIPRDTIPNGLYMDTSNPYHYFRVDNNRIIIGGEDHREMFPVAPRKQFKALRDYTKQLFPDITPTITHQWSGPVLEPSDGLPLIGPIAPNRFVISALSGNGMTYSTIAALMATEWVKGKRNQWASLYDPLRIPSLKQLYMKGKDYIAENWNGLVHHRHEEHG